MGCTVVDPTILIDHALYGLLGFGLLNGSIGSPAGTHGSQHEVEGEKQIVSYEPEGGWSRDAAYEEDSYAPIIKGLYWNNYKT